MNTPPVELAQPGAGLPKAEAFILRHLAFPAMKVLLSKTNSLELFAKSGESILSLVEPLDLDSLTKPVLIKRLAGLEDSSRYWSAEMTLEHIQIVSAGALYIIQKLEKNRPIDLPVRTADVKPTGGLGLDRVRAFREYLIEFPDKLAAFSYESRATHPHPWFGDMRSLDWLRLAAFHQNLHLKQIRAIVRGL